VQTIALLSAASWIALSMRPIGSTHTGQPGPWIMLTLAGSRSLMP